MNKCAEKLDAVNLAAMKLTRDLVFMDAQDGRLDRDAVMDLVARWRTEWAQAMRGRQPAERLYTATVEFDFVMVAEPHMTDRIVGSVVGQAFRDIGWSSMRHSFREGVHVDQWKPTDIPYGEHYGKTIGEYLKEGMGK